MTLESPLHRKVHDGFGGGPMKKYRAKIQQGNSSACLPYAIQQAAGIAQSWHTNRSQAYQDYVDDLLDYHEQQAEGTLDAGAEEPTWREWSIPILRQTCI